MQISIILGLCGAAMGAVDMQPFNQAVREDPSNYMAYYKRATAYLAQNNDAQALRDLSKTLELNPTFEPGLFYHARTNLRLGNAASAKDKLKQCGGRCTELLEQCNEYEQLVSAAEGDMKSEEWGYCITESSQALAIAPKSLKTLRIRYECYMGSGDAAHAFVDLTDIVSQDKGDASGVSKLALFEFLINNNQDKALQLLRRCINFDPDAKQCAETSKRLRSLQKELQAPKIQFKKLYKELSAEIKNLGLPEEDEQSALLASLHRKQCELFFKRGKWAQGAEVCARVRDVDPDFVPAVLLQAQLERENNNYREATELLSSLIRNGNKDPRLQALYQEIMMEYQQQRQRNYGGGQGAGGSSQAKGKDLYKILGVDKKATKKEIKKAYRELSKKFHPDKYKGDDLSKDQVMEKMQEINEAHEILSDDQRRQEYDSESSGGGGRPQGQPGGPGGFQFQGGGFPGADMNDILRQFMRQQQGGGGGFHF